MTDEIKETEKAEEKSEKDIDKIDKEYLSKAKNSRDLIDKKLRTFEDSIENISDTIKNGDAEPEKKEKKHETISEEVREAQIELDSTKAKIDDKEEYLTAIEETIKSLEERYNHKNEDMQNLEERFEIVTESKDTLEEEYKELLRNNEQLVHTFETRQVDLIVLTDSVKEKVSNQEKFRSILVKLNQEIQEKESLLERQGDNAEALEKKIKSLTAENETLKVSIIKNKFELDHTNNEIEVKEEEKKLLSEQIEKNETRIKIIEKNIEDYKDGFPEMEKQRETYEELIAKYKIQLSEKQELLIDVESKIQQHNDVITSIDEQILSKENLIKANETRLEDLKKDIEATSLEYTEREERMASLDEKLSYMNVEHEKLVKSKEVIDLSTSDAKHLLQKLKLELETQEEEIRDKESRIHRLEFLSLVYRLSKFFGGILIGVGILIIIVVLFGLTGILNFADIEILLFIILIIAGIFSVVSGIFHLEKS